MKAKLLITAISTCFVFSCSPKVKYLELTKTDTLYSEKLISIKADTIKKDIDYLKLDSLIKVNSKEPRIIYQKETDRTSLKLLIDQYNRLIAECSSKQIDTVFKEKVIIQQVTPKVEEKKSESFLYWALGLLFAFAIGALMANKYR